MAAKIFKNAMTVGLAVFLLSVALFMGMLYQYFGDQLTRELATEAAMVAQGVETILPGIGEGKILTGQDTPEGVAAFYHQRGVKNVVVKTGKEGAYFSQLGGKAGYSPAFPVKEKVDTVGAGDGFAAGVISALAEGESLEEATFRGNVIGAIQITHRSDNEGLPTRERLSQIILAGIA